MLRLVEWSEEGHRYRGELRTIGERRVWFVAVDDELPREAGEATWADADTSHLRKRLVQAMKDLG